MNRTLYFYAIKFKGKEQTYNKSMMLPSYFASMIRDKKKVVIAELGAGIVNTIGNEWPGVEVEIHASDVLWPEYQKIWEKNKKTPLVPIEYQDFETLNYPDSMFDIVHVVNALDHTKNVLGALQELQRVCKPGGWIYLRHAPDQKSRYGGMHQWNCSKEGFSNGQMLVKLSNYETHIEDDLIVSICHKI